MKLKSDTLEYTEDVIDYAQEGGSQGCTSAVPMYDMIRLEQKIVDDTTLKLYADSDEPSENKGEYETSWFHKKKNKGSASLCWRRGRKPMPQVRPVASYINETTRDVFSFQKKKERSGFRRDHQANEMRYCPGDHCRVSFPVYQFSKNANVYPDGLDRYCVQCNYRRTQELSLKRKRARLGATCVVDSLEQFRVQKSAKKYEKFDRHTRIKNMVLRKIEISIQDERTTVPLSTEMVFSALFGGRLFHCKYTGKRMTKKCFLDHHRISFHENPGRIDVHCSGCSIPEDGDIKAFVFS
jgi:hypothetical protein